MWLDPAYRNEMACLDVQLCHVCPAAPLLQACDASLTSASGGSEAPAYRKSVKGGSERRICILYQVVAIVLAEEKDVANLPGLFLFTKHV